MYRAKRDIKKCVEMCVSPIRIRHPTEKRFIDVPCGKCIECLEKKRNFWSLRLQQELKYSTKYCYFFTLTYAPECVPTVFDDTDLPYCYTLDKDDLKKFVRSIRDALRYECKKKGLDFKDNNFRYFCVGEYGSTGLRPHYHGMLFDFPFDLNVTQELIKNYWNKGFIQIDYLHDGGCHYQAKYMVKPSGLPDQAIKPFLICSKGIGKSYLTDSMMDFHYFNDNVQIVQNNKKFSPVLPRYYRDKIWSNEGSKENLADTLRCRYFRYINDIIDNQFDGDIVKYEQNKSTLIAYKEHRFFKSLQKRKL